MEETQIERGMKMEKNEIKKYTLKPAINNTSKVWHT